MELAKLDEPFYPKDIEWRVQQCGISNNKPWCMVLAYVTNRAIQQRLDEVCGKENWQNDYHPAPDGGVMCSIKIKINGEWITKKDGAENTQIEAVKGGISGAMKRAGVQWGIGRYLYDLEEGFAKTSLEKVDGWNRTRTKDGSYIWWETPILPDWALPREYILSLFGSEASSCKTEDELRAVYAKYYKRCDALGIGDRLKSLSDRYKHELGGKQ